MIVDFPLCGLFYGQGGKKSILAGHEQELNKTVCLFSLYFDLKSTGQKEVLMDLSKLGIITFLDALPGRETGQFARRVEQLGYSVLWVPDAMGREVFSLS